MRCQSVKQAEKQAALRELFEETVLERDDFTCCRCGTTGTKLDPHHLVARTAAPDLVLDPDNLVSLCRRDHRQIEDHLCPDWRSWKLKRHDFETKRESGTLPWSHRR